MPTSRPIAHAAELWRLAAIRKPRITEETPPSTESHQPGAPRHCSAYAKEKTPLAKNHTASTNVAIEKVGIDKGFQQQVRDMVKPGTSALFLVVRKVTPDRALATLSKYGGTVLKTSLTAHAEEELQEALRGSARSSESRTQLSWQPPLNLSYRRRSDLSCRWDPGDGERLPVLGAPSIGPSYGPHAHRDRNLAIVA